ncbi:MAG: hypothetical protein U0105_01920 [Candidatus Obscuribacterales bacterium]
MEKKLKLDKPLVFANRTPLYNVVTMLGMFVAISVIPLLFEFNAASAGISGLMAVIFIPIALYIWHTISGVVIVDRDGFEVKSKLKSKRLPWGHVSSRSHMTFKGSTTYYVHGLNKEKISFGEAVMNTPYILQIVDTVVESRPGSEWLDVPPAPRVTIFPGGPIATTFILAVMTLVGALLVVVGHYQNYVNIIEIPTISAQEARKYADKPNAVVRLRGPLHADSPVQSRDEKNTYALQVAFLTYGPSSRDEKVLDVWAPGLAWIGSGADRVKISMNDPIADYLEELESGTLRAGWKKSDLANSISDSMDEDIDQILKKNSDVGLVLYAIPQDAEAMAVGKVVQSGDHLLLRPLDERTWISTKSLDDMKTSVMKWMMLGLAAVLWGAIGIISGVRDIVSYRSKGHINW